MKKNFQIKSLFLNLFNFILKISSSAQACVLNNLRQKIMNRNIVFKYYKNQNLFEVINKDLKMFFNDKMRGMTTYAYGIEHRANSLASTYNLDLIQLENNDTIIDCGANFGDIYLWLKLKNIKTKYFSFEPSIEEFKCIELNCPGQENNNMALSNKIGRLDFFVKSDTGDSSLIEPALGYTEKVSIKTITLDEYVKRKNIEKIKLFKLEAEGSEPEVIEGAKNSLPKIKFIAVDGGPERGLKEETTIEYVSNFLLKNDFKVISFKTDGTTIKGLFKNTKI
jgi:FkbM family methyltransferase